MSRFSRRLVTDRALPHSLDKLRGNSFRSFIVCPRSSLAVKRSTRWKLPTVIRTIIAFVVEWAGPPSVTSAFNRKSPGQDYGELVRGQLAVLVSEADPAVELREVNEQFLDARHTNEDDAYVVMVEAVTGEFKASCPETIGHRQ